MSQLPTPGRLILENVTLLAGSPTAFHARYGFTLTPTTFAKPGNTAPANALLHFLISIIDSDVADSLFKPCFPILDRDQERDFRKVVDARLAILERTKLIPVGCARKSVIASAGGDRFLDLLWSLSSLALQQACLRHPAYASVSRMRLLSQPHSDTASQLSFTSQHSASRSSRSLLSVRSARTERPTSDPSRHRRFLGVGMLSASQQRQKDAEQLRARIDSERIALNRTTEMGQNGAKTWASEAEALRERIGEFEAKLRRLKGQLADMGFDENGNDIRASTAQAGHAAAISETKPALDAGATGGPLVPSPSGDDLLKTSPIESTESCSSVDDAGDACDDLAADLSRLLTFTVESEGERVDVEHAVEVEKPVIPFAIDNSTEVLSGSETTVDEDAQRNPKDILHLVRMATDELEEATNRMHEIREARERAGRDLSAEIKAYADADTQVRAEALELDGALRQRSQTRSDKDAETEDDSDLTEKTETEATFVDQNDSTLGCEPTASQIGSEEPGPVSEVEDAGSNLDTPAPLAEKVSQALEEHHSVVESSRQLQKEAAAFSAKAVPTSTPEDDILSADSPSGDNFVEAISKPQWYSSALANATKAKKHLSQAPGTKKHGRPPRGHLNTLSDVSVAAKALQGYGPSYPARSSATRRRKEGTRSLDSINLDLNSIDKRSCSSSGNEMDVLYSPSESNSSLKGTPRSVRFAELPPSYSASRTSDNSRESSPVRNVRSSDERFVQSINKALEDRSGNNEDETHSDSGRLKEPVVTSVLEERAEKEGTAKEGIRSFVSKKGSRPIQKFERMLRADTNAVRNENGRAGAVSSQKPPRLQRARTQHRIVRPKDVGQRSFLSRQLSSPITQPARPFPSRSPSLDSISSLRKAHSNSAATRDLEQESLEAVDSMEVDGKATVRDSPEGEAKQLSSRSEPNDDKREHHNLQASDEETVEDNSSAKKEAVQKKLFMTPESVVSSSKSKRDISRLPRRSNTEILLSSNSSNVTSTSNVSKDCDVTAVVKDSSVEFPSTDEEELLFSPTAKPPLPEKPETRKVGNGFFAGQAAEWQQSVRAQSNAGEHTAATSGRGLPENTGRSGRSSGKTSSSGMRSRVQSFRARLAALK